MVIGLSTIVGVTAIPFQSSVILKILSGNSLEIGGTFCRSNGATAAFTWTKGYLLGTSEVLSFNCTGTFYLAATGATVTVHMLRGLGQGSDG